MLDPGTGDARPRAMLLEQREAEKWPGAPGILALLFIAAPASLR